MIVGLTGQARSGKDTVGAHLIKKHNFKRIAFVAQLKQSVAALFDLPVHLVDEYKLDTSIVVRICHNEESSREMTFRQFLQRYGTEAHRDVFGEDFWIDLALPLDGIYTQHIVLTDLRFPNEVKRIKDLGGHVIKIVRPSEGNVDPHRSEILVDTIASDYTVLNDTTIEEMLWMIDKIIEPWL